MTPSQRELMMRSNWWNNPPLVSLIWTFAARPLFVIALLHSYCSTAVWATLGVSGRSDGCSLHAAWIIDALIAWVFMDTKRLFLLLWLTCCSNLKSTSPASRYPAPALRFRDDTVKPLFLITCSCNDVPNSFPAGLRHPLLAMQCQTLPLH